MANKLGWYVATDKSIDKQVVYVLSGNGEATGYVEDEYILCITPLIEVDGYLACKHNGIVYDLMSDGLRNHEDRP